MTTLILAALTVLLTAGCGHKPPTTLDVTPYQGRVCDLVGSINSAVSTSSGPEFPVTTPRALRACGKPATPES